MSFKTLEDQHRAVEAAAWENAKRETIAQVYAKYPATLIHCQANDQQIIAIITRFAGPDALPSLDLFLSALDENPSALGSLAQQPEAITRQQLTEQIIELLAAKGKGHDAFTLRQEEKRLAMLPIPALRARLADLQMKAGMAATDVTTLKRIVADAHRDQSQFPGYSNLPPTMWDETKHVRVDADYLNELARSDIWQFKKLVRLYGSEQIDVRRGLKK
jgi:hypothetical protein